MTQTDERRPSMSIYLQLSPCLYASGNACRQAAVGNEAARTCLRRRITFQSMINTAGD